MPTRVRLDRETEALLRTLAHTSGRTKSEVIQEALHRMSEEVRSTAKTGSLYHAIEDLVGIAENGPKDLARQHKHRYRERTTRNIHARPT